MATTPKRSTRETYRHLPRLLNLLWTLAALALLSACLESNPDHPVLALETLDADDDIARQLTEHEIDFFRRDAGGVENYRIGLTGEIHHAKEILASDYTLDWENTTAYPNVSFHGVPLLAPLFLTDAQDHLHIVVTDIGNLNGVKGAPQMEAFDDDQVMDLKTILTELHGEPTASKEDYRGQVYFWQLPEQAIRLEIENECLCEKAGKNGSLAGRGGTLTLYYAPSLPEFHDESQDF